MLEGLIVALMIIAICLIAVTVLIEVKINDNIKDLIKQKTSELEKIKRKHTQISSVNFENTLTGRNDTYKKYKNKYGLYEPVKAKNGIEIKVRKDT